jgi:fructose-1,6-bisphosphatase/inositol monophosphatase family enzyme
LSRPALPDADRVAWLMARVAATEIMPRFRKLDSGDVSRKAQGELVTVADVAAERALTSGLAELSPEAAVIGEEAYAADPGILDRLTGEAPVWLVDPIDGTANFASGVTTFAVMVAFVWHGETLAGWIYDPIADRSVWAMRGEGAWRDGRRLEIAAVPEGGLGIGNRQLARKISGRSDFFRSTFGLRCVGHEYVALASGAAHFALYNRLLPWDHAAGVLIHSESGGFNARLDRSPYDPRQTTGGLLLAPDPASWQAVRSALPT